MPVVGVNPIQYYYPNGYGELKIVAHGSVSGGSSKKMTWVTPEVLNRSYNETSPIQPIYEGQKVIRPDDSGSDCETAFGIRLRIRAAYQSFRNAAPTTGGTIKYTIISGTFPSGLTLDMDTGNLYGKIDTLETIYGDRYGTDVVPADSQQDLKAASDYKYNFGEQTPKRYTENNYGKSGSVTLHKDGFAIPEDVNFIARAFNADNPTSDYIDGYFTLKVSNNWSADRDELILNIRNQFFIDGKPVSNKEYLATMKSRGYFSSCC